MCELIVDCPHSTPKWTDEGVVVLRNQNIRNGILDLSSPSFTNEEDYQKRIKRAVPQAGDIVFTREAPMGEVCIIPEGLKCCLGQRQVLLRPKKDVSGEYLFWALQSPHVQHQISWNEGTGTTVSNVRIPVLKSLQIPRHPEDEAQVAQVLSALANKISLNRQINQTLEQMAQALFKSWFVDFDPVIDNALAAGNPIPEPMHNRARQRGWTPDEGARRASAMDGASQPRAQIRQQQRQAQRQQQTGSSDSKLPQLPADIRNLFPSEFEHTEELGWVPKGWDHLKSGDVIDVRDGTHDSPKKAEQGFPLVTSKHITSGVLKLEDANLISEEDFELVNQRSKVEQGDILLTMIGTVGIPYLVMQKKVNFAIKNIGLFRTSASELYQYYFFHLLKSQGMQNYLEARKAGTTQKYLSLKVLRSIDFLSPPESLLKVFNEQLSLFMRRIHQNSESGKSLSKLRDTLLPKLISGCLVLPEAESINN